MHDIVPGTEELLARQQITGYIGFDPTSDSLHIGSLLPIMLLVQFQRAGHKPIAVVGGATGMIGDPSGKSEERNLLTPEQIQQNLEGIQNQLSKFLDFEAKENSAEIINNYDFYKDMNVLAFLRDIGKHLTVNYMAAKDSVKNRMEGGSGISFTEFSYQLLQAYDFAYLYKQKNCLLQMGGSDQWGNITSGVELVRRLYSGEAYAITCPLVTKADGGKFGKTESGNVWLDPEKTSPYKFYQFWLNASDEDAINYVKIFTLFSKEEVEVLIAEHEQAPHERKLQKVLAKDLTVRVHSERDYEVALKASQILFGKGEAVIETLKSLEDRDFNVVFDGVPQFSASKSELENGGVNIVEFLADKANVFPSRGEVRRAIKEGSLSLNKQKVDDPDQMISKEDLLNQKYIVTQRGKKNYFLVIAE